MTIDTEYFRKRLETEKNELEAGLDKVGRKDPDNPSNWEVRPPERDEGQADENIVADSISEFENNNATLNTLEARYRDVKSGLDKIKHGVYGTCQVCKSEIEEDRLEANPAARTCKEHMN